MPVWVSRKCCATAAWSAWPCGPAGGFRKIGDVASNVGDRTIIDGWIVNGSARLVGWTSSLMRQLQTGYIYHYALSMVIGVVALLTWWVVR